jgi:hypothetical protein
MFAMLDDEAGKRTRALIEAPAPEAAATLARSPTPTPRSWTRPIEPRESSARPRAHCDRVDQGPPRPSTMLSQTLRADVDVLNASNITTDRLFNCGSPRT